MAQDVVDPALLPLLVDPETHAPLSVLDATGLEALRARVADGTARRADGQAVPEFDAALVPTGGGRFVYLVVDGLPNLLIDDRLEVDAPIAGA